KDAFVALLDLDGKVVGNDGLTAVVLVAVGVADVNHDAWRQPGLAKPLCGCLGVFRRIIGRFPAPPDDGAVFVSTSGNNGRVPPLGYRQEVMRLGSRLDGINGDANAAAGTVLEPYRAGKPRSQLTVDLTFGRACANGSPGHQVGDVLGRDHVEVFATCGQAHGVDVNQQFSGGSQALVDIEAAIKVGIVDQAFPADRCARFFKIDTHDDFQVITEALTLRLQPSSVIQGGLGIVNGAGTNDHHQPVIRAGQPVAHGPAGR